MAAVKACVDAITGKISPEQFREVLLRAADEAGIRTLSLVPQRMGERRPHVPPMMR